MTYPQYCAKDLDSSVNAVKFMSQVGHYGNTEHSNKSLYCIRKYLYSSKKVSLSNEQAGVSRCVALLRRAPMWIVGRPRILGEADEKHIKHISF